MINQPSVTDIEANPLLKVPDIYNIIRYVVWWQSPEQAMESFSWSYLFCRILLRGLPADKELLIKICGEDVAREALKKAPSGEFTRESWPYWNKRFGIEPVPPLPKRFPDVPDRPASWGPWT